MSKKRIGDVLIESGLVKPQELQEALRQKKEKGGRLGEILIGLGVLTEESFQHLLAKHFGLSYFEASHLLTLSIDWTLLKQVSYQMALQFLLLPYEKEGNTLKVVSLAPLSKADEQSFRRATHTLHIEYALSTRQALNRAIRYHFGRFLQKQATTKEQNALQSPKTSQELFTLRRQGNCVTCGYPSTEGDLLCRQCNAPLKGSNDPFVGKLVGQHWKLVKQLGEGGMGMVYQGVHTQTSQPCAVKLLRANSKRDEAVIQRFYREVQILRRLRHPNIIEVYEFAFMEELGFFLVMELLEGCTFAEYLDEVGQELPLSEIYLILSQICDAMAHAHEQNIIHRDLKPENVFLVGGPDQIEQIKILDFGIAKLQEEEQSRLTQTGMTLGTPHYLSPEQAVAKDVGPESDIYSLTVILFELLTGDMLFDADSPFQYLMRHVYTDPRTLKQARPEKHYGQKMEALVKMGLSKRPGNRPKTMSEFKNLLNEAIQEGLQYDPDEDMPAPARKKGLGEYRMERPDAGRRPDETALPTADLEEEYTPAAQVPSGDRPTYLLTDDEWDDDDAQTEEPPSVIVEQPVKLRMSEQQALPKIEIPEHAKKQRPALRGAVWESAHKNEARRRLVLWFTLLLLLLGGGAAFGTYPLWRHEFFPTENERRQVRDLWKEVNQLPRQYGKRHRTKRRHKKRKRRRRRR